jgi:hypothetical protein
MSRKAAMIPMTIPAIAPADSPPFSEFGVPVRGLYVVLKIVTKSSLGMAFEKTAAGAIVKLARS